jgi:flagellar protein FliO/FliZ
MMKSLQAFVILISYPAVSYAQAANAETSAPEQVVEVGKHVSGELNSMSMILSLLFVLAIIIGSAWLLKKFQGVTQHSSDLKVITSLSLGTKERLVVVQVGEKQLLLGLTGQQISLLDTLDKPLEAKAAISPDITQSLMGFINKKNTKNVEQSMANNSHD